MYKIVASDLDGTLLNQDHIIGAFTRNVLQRLHKQGEHFVFATGRHHIDVAHIRQSVGIPAFMITSNGARVHDVNDNVIFSHDIDKNLITDLVKLTQNEQNISIHIYRENDWLVSQEEKDLEKYHKDSGFHYDIFDIKKPPQEGIAKLFYISQNHDLLLSYEHKLKAQFEHQISVAFSTPFCLEVMGAGVSKGSALLEVAKLKGFNLDDCIAFGDGMNDVEMLSSVSKGLVMENAPQRVKDTLSHLEVIGNNHDEAVAHYLEKYLL